MSDKVIVRKGSINNDGTGQADLPVKMYDNGDGTYSELVSVTGNLLSASPVQKTPVAASTSSVTLLAANANRKQGSLFTNNSVSATLYLSLSGTATTAAARILYPGDCYLMTDTTYKGIVTGIWDAAVGYCNVEEAV